MSCADNHFRARRAKQQRERRDKKRAQDVLWNATIGPNSDHLKEAQKTLEPNITDEFSAASDAQLEPWEKAPRHLQDRRNEDCGFDDVAVKKQVRLGGEGRGKGRADEAKERQSELRLRYPGWIGKRNAAKNIYRLERERLEDIETNDEKIPSIRTLQKIFKNQLG